MGTELTVASGAALVQMTKDDYRAIIESEGMGDYIPGAELIEQEDLPFAQIKLAQGTGTLPEHLGKWVHSITGQVVDKFEAVLLSFAKGRTCFAKFGDDSAEEVVLCGSNDALFPRDKFIGEIVYGESINGKPCTSCPLAQFGENGEAPKCSKVYTFALLDKTLQIPAVASFKKTGVKSARVLAYLVKYPTVGRFHYVIIGSERVTDKKNMTYYVPTVSIGGETTPEVRTIAREISLAAGNLAARVDVTEQDPLVGAAGEMGGVVSEGPNAPPDLDIPWDTPA
jgi:hypothetical protein